MRGYRMVWQCPGPRTVGWSGLGAVRVRDLPELVAGLALQSCSSCGKYRQDTWGGH